jgi:thiol-disulfide isomerase/thioredoxin
VRRVVLALSLVAALPLGPSFGRPVAAQEPALAIERLVTLAREELAASALVAANRHAEDAYRLAVTALEAADVRDAARIRTALGTAIETRASVMVEEGARAEAVRFLRLELGTNRDNFLRPQLQAALDRANLEGRPAPGVSSLLHLGPRLPNADQLKGKVVLLFFWAHWCVQCRADGPIVERLVSKYRGQGLTIVAPTQRYGYVEAGRPAAPARELRHIVEVRDTHYRFLRNEPVPIGEANYREYGVTTIPMYVLLDRQGIVRLYRAGRMTAEELEAAIRELL